MTKKIDVQYVTIGSIGTSAKWYRNSAPMELLNNSGKTDIRLDKLMLQMTAAFNGASNPIVLGCIVHLSDETGATLDNATSIVDGTTTDALMETLLNQWKDNVFLTDFRIVGTGYTTAVTPMITMEADTKRILKPGQVLYVTLLAQPLGTETSKTASIYVDSMLWYSAAAQ